MAALGIEIFLLGYLAGSFPSGYLAGRLSGVDVRKHGSGNIGATNVLRILGKRWGILVFVADALKGLLAVRCAIFLAQRTPGTGAYVEFYAILAAAACVVGHSFPVWLHFRGGQGVDTSVGSLAGVMPIAALSIFAVWLIVFKITRYVSLASIVAATALPLVVAVLVQMQMTKGTVLFYFSCAMAALVVWRHRSNMARLRSGSEPRFSKP